MKRLARTLAAFAAHRLRFADLPYALHRLVRGQYVVAAFVYHRIVDSRATASFYTDYERGLDTGIFSRHLDVLTRHFHMVDLDTFLAIVSGRRPAETHSALLTFDDADAGFIDYALPELRRRDIPAAIMAPVQLIGTADQFWHVRVSNAIRHADDRHWDEIVRRAGEWPAPVAAVVRRYSALPPPARRRPLARAVNLALDQVHHDDIDRLLAAWQRLIAPAAPVPVYCMDWEALRYLERHRIAIESHTLSHRKLPYLSDEEIACELSQSKLTLKEKLGKRVRAVAYPQGRYERRIGDAARAAGYEAGFTTVRLPCRYPLAPENMFALPRLDLGGETYRELEFHLAKAGTRWIRQTP